MRAFICIGFRVSSTFGQSDGDMSGTPKTMGGLSSRPNLYSLIDTIKPREPKLAVICY